MIEGGGLGVYAPEDDRARSTCRCANGVVDVAVRRRGRGGRASPSSTCRTSTGPIADVGVRRPDALRAVIPENRLRVYDVRAVDRRARRHRLGARAAAAASALGHDHRAGPRRGPAARHRRQQPDAPRRAPSTPTAPTRRRASCSCATPSTCRCCSSATRPGSWSAPRPSRPALVRHVSRLFVTGANLTVPFVTIVLRKGYGLGAQAMAGGSFKAPLFCVAWPTGEFGGMGLEGAVRLGYRKELEADRRRRRARARCSRRWSTACTSTARRSTPPSHFEIDDVIDPADSRRWITTALAAAPPPAAARRQEAPQHRHLVRRHGRVVQSVTQALDRQGRRRHHRPALRRTRPPSRPRGSRPSAPSTRPRPPSAWPGPRWPTASRARRDPRRASRATSGCSWRSWPRTPTTARSWSPGQSLVTADDGRARSSSADRRRQRPLRAAPRVRRPRPGPPLGPPRPGPHRRAPGRAGRVAVAADGSLVVPYLNRLSSLLWTLARWVEGEPLPDPTAHDPDP